MCISCVYLYIKTKCFFHFILLSLHLHNWIQPSLFASLFQSKGFHISLSSFITCLILSSYCKQKCPYLTFRFSWAVIRWLLEEPFLEWPEVDCSQKYQLGACTCCVPQSLWNWKPYGGCPVPWVGAFPDHSIGYLNSQRSDPGSFQQGKTTSKIGFSCTDLSQFFRPLTKCACLDRHPVSSLEPLYDQSNWPV